MVDKEYEEYLREKREYEEKERKELIEEEEEETPEDENKYRHSVDDLKDYLKDDYPFTLSSSDEIFVSQITETEFIVDQEIANFFEIYDVEPDLDGYINPKSERLHKNKITCVNYESFGWTQVVDRVINEPWTKCSQENQDWLDKQERECLSSSLISFKPKGVVKPHPPNLKVNGKILPSIKE
jgi:hypothetical protein|tara:strand:- start:2749 stop:3297 length:549 start_codon:yes stop_codon:yes gene_type:complete